MLISISSQWPVRKPSCRHKLNMVPPPKWPMRIQASPLFFIIFVLTLNCCSHWAGLWGTSHCKCRYKELFLRASSLPLHLLLIQVLLQQGKSWSLPPRPCLFHNKDLTCPISHIRNLVFHCWQWCTLDNTQALRKQICGNPLSPSAFCECIMWRVERWRPNGTQEPS